VEIPGWGDISGPDPLEGLEFLARPEHKRVFKFVADLLTLAWGRSRLNHPHSRTGGSATRVRRRIIPDFVESLQMDIVGVCAGRT